MENIKISNFRKIKDTWDLDLAPITFFTGKNNSGKSSVLKGLMVISDFCNSKNHFEINFNGENKDDHKIKDYSNAINWNNNKKSNLEFDFVRSGYAFNLVFKPKVNSYKSTADEDQFSKGQLVSLKVVRMDDSALLEIVQNNLGYQINIDDTYLRRKFTKGDFLDPDARQLKQTLVEIEGELKEVEKDIKEKLSKNPSLLKTLGWTSIAGISALPLAAMLTGPLFIAGAGAAAIYSSTKGRELIAQKEKAEKLQASKKNVLTKLTNFDKENSSRNNSANVLRPQFSLNEISNVGLEVDKILRNQTLQYLETHEKELGKSDKKKDAETVFQFAENILNALRFDIYHLSPNRNSQTRLYYNRDGASDINEILEKYSAAPLLDDSKEKLFLLDWLKRLEIGTNYKISNVSGQANLVEIYEEERWIDLVDKGFGAGQLFTILLQIAMASVSQRDKDSPILLIEEPESNLHPKLQTDLANLFLDSYNKLGVRFIIETHSEYILRKTQLIVNKSSKPNPFVVYYFGKDGPYRLNYKEDGSFDKNFGEGFFDVVDDIALEMFLKNNRIK